LGKGDRGSRELQAWAEAEAVIVLENERLKPIVNYRKGETACFGVLVIGLAMGFLVSAHPNLDF
jgi:hypothetical protein